MCSQMFFQPNPDEPTDVWFHKKYREAMGDRVSDSIITVRVYKIGTG